MICLKQLNDVREYDKQVGDDVHGDQYFVGQNVLVIRPKESYHPADAPEKHDAGHHHACLVDVIGNF